jgi:hypothetical protein
MRHPDPAYGGPQLFCDALKADPARPYCSEHRLLALAPIAPPRRIVVPKDQRLLVFAAPAEVDELVEIAA